MGGYAFYDVILLKTHIRQPYIKCNDLICGVDCGDFLCAKENSVSANTWKILERSVRLSARLRDQENLQLPAVCFSLRKMPATASQSIRGIT